MLTVTAPTAKSLILEASTDTCTPAVVAFVLTKLLSPVTAKDTSPSLRYLLPVVPVSPVNPIPFVVAFTTLVSNPTVMVWLLTVAVTPFAPATFNF